MNLDSSLTFPLKFPVMEIPVNLCTVRFEDDVVCLSPW